MNEFNVIDFSDGLYLLSRTSAYEERVAFSGGHEECVKFLELMGTESVAKMSEGGQFWEKREGGQFWEKREGGEFWEKRHET